MANTMLKLIAIFSIILMQTLQHYHRQTTALSLDKTVEDEQVEEDEEEYILDTPLVNMPRLRRSRFLASVIKKGTRCTNATTSVQNVCNGVWANNGKSLLYCCKKHCRNTSGDMNNCGGCGHKCKLGQKCCNGVCIDVLFNPGNCGKCGRRCSSGVKCVYGFCGYV